MPIPPEPGRTERDASEESVAEGRVASFRYAFRGIAHVLRSQANAWIHLVATVAVVLAGFLLGIDRTEWLAILLAIGGVWVAESLNTAFEALCDVASPDYHPQVERAKDVAAGAVLLAAVAAVGVGLLVFAPRLLLLVAAWSGGAR